VLTAVRQSGGAIVAVSESEIITALRDLARKGFYVEPTSAAGVAGLTRLVASGAIKPRDTTVMVLTGSGLKASERIGELLQLRARAD
jgi:threonine synthase